MLPDVAPLLLTVGLLLAASAVLSRVVGRTGVPLAVLFLALGTVVGALRHVPFGDVPLAMRLGTAALVAILFDGGLNTPLAGLTRVLRPAVLLATIGVVLTAAVVALAARLFGLSWIEALLVGAVVSSTDAAAVFAVLRGSGVQLKRRVGLTLEVESGLNDAMAVLLTVALTRALAGATPGGLLSWRLLAELPLQLAIGGGVGVAVGWAGRPLLRRARLPAGGLYPVLTLGLAFVAFGLPSLFGGSGFLAVYVAAVVLGNGEVPYRGGLLRVHDTLAWLAQIAMFFFLGLLVSPLRVWEEAGAGVVIAAVLALVARPLSVLPCVLPFRYPARETAYVGWVGLRGAVPIILAMFAMVARPDVGARVLDIVYCVVVVNAIFPGATVRWATRRLGLQSTEPPPHAVLEINSTQLLDAELRSFHVDAVAAVAGARTQELPLPPGASLLLVVRGSELIAPRGDTELRAGDHVYVFCKPADLAFVQLLFGRAEEEAP